jgi:transcriptional regulator with XRE-family HTH domain
MTRRGVTVCQLAEMLGLSGHSQVSRWLAGEHPPRPERLQGLANALEVELVVHEVYRPTVRVGDEKCHQRAESVTKSVTGRNGADSLGDVPRKGDAVGRAGLNR